MVARRVCFGLLCAAGGVGAVALPPPARGISVHKQPKTEPLRSVLANEQVSFRAVEDPVPVEEAKPSEPPAPRTRKAWTPTYMKAQDGTWIPVKIVGYGSKTATYNVIVMPTGLGLSPYEVPDVSKSVLRKVEEFEEVIPEKASRKTAAAPAKEHGKGHYVKMTVKDAEGSEILQAKVLSGSPMRALMHMTCDKLKLGKWSCEMDTAFFTKTGSQVNATDTPDTLELAEGAEITIARHTAELHGKYAHKDYKAELQKQLAAEEAARQEAAKQEAPTQDAATQDATEAATEAASK